MGRRRTAIIPRSHRNNGHPLRHRPRSAWSPTTRLDPLAGRRRRNRARSTRTYDGLDVTVAADAAGQLELDLACTSPAAPKSARPHGATRGSPTTKPLSPTGPRRRQPHLGPSRSRTGDRLQVGLDRKHVIFAPGELLELRIRPHLLATRPARRCDSPRPCIRPSTESPLDDTTISRLRPTITPARLAALAAPARDGRGLRRRPRTRTSDLSSRLRMSAPVERRKLQIVVLSPQRQPASRSSRPSIRR